MNDENVEFRIPVKHFVEGGPPYRAVVDDIEAVLAAAVEAGILQRVEGIPVMVTWQDGKSFGGSRDEKTGWVLS